MKKIGIWIFAIVIWAVLACVLPVSGQNRKAVPKANPAAILETAMGKIRVELFAGKAPITTKNFIDYANSGFYKGTIVHRVDFVIGLGGYMENLQPRQPTRPPIKNESQNGLKNQRGTLAMARYKEPGSATSQFFINLKDNVHLDASRGEFGYAVFGKVIEGMNVVDAIAGVKTGNVGSFSNIPLQTVLIKSVKIE